MAKTSRPQFRINDLVTIAPWMRPIPAYSGKPFVGREKILRVSRVSGTGSVRNPWMVSVTDDAGSFWNLPPSDFALVADGSAK